MGKFEGLLLVSDFDDTLYTADKYVPERNLRALERFEAEGGLFTVATGRAHRTFAPYVDLVPINAPVILSNGSALYDFQENRMLEQTYLPDTAPEDLEAFLEEFPTVAMEAYYGEDIYVWHPNFITDAHMKKVGTTYTVAPIREMPRPWTKAILQEIRPVGLRARRRFLELYGDRYEAIFSNHFYLELTAKGSSKGGMATRLARRLGIAPGHMYCAGDNQNDIAMLELSPIPFAPSDCAQEVRDWGARLLCPCAEGIMGDIVGILDRLY